jgi:Domain of unknown function (DUF4136)
MRSIRRLTAIAASGLLAAACATMNVSSQVQRDLDFSQYHTYEWGEPDTLPADDSRLATPFFRDHLEGAVERALTAKGFARASAAGADLLIHYHASVNERIDVRRADRGRGYGDEVNGVDVETFDAGTIVIDVVDAKTNRVVWRGWAQQELARVLDNPDRMAEMINQAVNRLMARFPRPL